MTLILKVKYSQDVSNYLIALILIKMGIIFIRVILLKGSNRLIRKIPILEGKGIITSGSISGIGIFPVYNSN